MVGGVCGMLNQYWETLWDGWWGMEEESKYGRTYGSQTCPPLKWSSPYPSST